MEAKTNSGTVTSKDVEKCSPKRSARGRCRLPYVEPAMVLYNLAVMGIAPLQSQYIYRRTLNRYNITMPTIPENSTELDSPREVDIGLYSYQEDAQAESSLITMWLYLALMIPTLLVVIPLGAHSDRAGRKWAILPPTAAEVIRLGLSCLVVFFELPLWVLGLGSICSGLSGSTNVFIVGAYAYIVDVTTTDNRAMRLTILEVLVGIANTLTQLITGFFIQHLGFFFAYVTLLTITVTNLIYVVFFLKESNKAKGPSKLLASENFTRPILLYIKDNGTGRRLILITALLICALNALIVYGSTGVTTLYFLNTPLCWSSVMIGIFNAYSWIIRGTTPVLWLALFRRRLTERGLVIMGAVSTLCYYAIMSQATRTWVVYLAPIGGIAMELTTAMARVTGSEHVSPKEQGAMFTSFSLVSLLSVLLGVVLFNTVYPSTLHISHTFVFYLQTILCLLIIILSVILFVTVRRRTNRRIAITEISTPSEDAASQNNIAKWTRF